MHNTVVIDHGTMYACFISLGRQVQVVKAMRVDDLDPALAAVLSHAASASDLTSHRDGMQVGNARRRQE